MDIRRAQLLKYLAKHLGASALVGMLALGFAAFGFTAGASAAGMEKCYGIAKAGRDDGSTAAEIPGMSTVDYDGSAFKYVTKGTCQEISTPFGPGSLRPLTNRPPKGH